jgi:hypothetical protein
MAEKAPMVFISHAREDAEKAKKIYKDLASLGVNSWLDQESILPGQNWKAAINQAIKDCRYFLALLSQNSVNKKGYVQKELAEALDILDEFPPSEIFVVPVRLDDCMPSHSRLNDLHWADMFPNWEDGLKKIVSAITADGHIKLRSNAVDIEPSTQRTIAFMGNGINELDERIFRETYNVMIEIGKEDINADDVARKFIEAGVSNETINESLVILHNRRYIKAQMIFGENVAFVRPTGFGFDKYINTYKNEYLSLYQAVADEIIRGKDKMMDGNMMTSRDIATALNQSDILVRLVLYYFKSKRYMDLGPTIGALFVGLPSTEFIRKYKIA